jgi:hypothetical protein
LRSGVRRSGRECLLPGSGGLLPEACLCRSGGLCSGVRCSGGECLLPGSGGLRSCVRRSGRLLPEGLCPVLRRSGVRTQGLRTVRSVRQVRQALRPRLCGSGRLLPGSELRRSGELLHDDRLLCRSLRDRSVDLSVDDRLLCQGSSQGDS